MPGPVLWGCGKRVSSVERRQEATQRQHHHPAPHKLTSHTTLHTQAHPLQLSPLAQIGAMPKSFGDRAGDMLVGAALTASLGAVALLLRKRKEKGQVRLGRGGRGTGQRE
jgi:hypothetical protein